MEPITDFLMDNSDTIVEYSKIAWGFISTTVVGASIITAFTKTKDSKWYKLVEVLALLVKKAKE